jgi:hypothetical protein
MVKEKRRSKRYAVLHGARLTEPDGAELGSCRIINISQTGARLQTTLAPTLPEHFILVLSHTGGLRRQCAVVWRSDTAVGVEFLPDNPLSRLASKTASTFHH